MWSCGFLFGVGNILLIPTIQLLPWKSGLISLDSVRFFFFLLRMLILSRINILGKDVLFFLVLVPSALCFSTREVFTFFLLFEMIVFPMGLYICSGKTGERSTATWFFFLYTLILSIPFFLCLVVKTKDGEISSFVLFEKTELSWFLLVLTLMLIVKFPVFVVHRWLPRAHVEAPTLGSVLLARVLLKLGSYAMLRMIFCTRFVLNKFSVLAGIFGAFLASVLCFAQRDFKALIAMSRVAHMRGLWSAAAASHGVGFDVNVLISVSHGFVSAGLFFFVGQMYEHRGSRSLLLLRDVPSFSLFEFFSWALICFCNAGLPPFLSFFGEILGAQALIISCMLISAVFLAYGFVSGLFSFCMFDWSSSGKSGGAGSSPKNYTFGVAIVAMLFWNLGVSFIF